MKTKKNETKQRIIQKNRTIGYDFVFENDF